MFEETAKKKDVSSSQSINIQAMNKKISYYSTYIQIECLIILSDTHTLCQVHIDKNICRVFLIDINYERKKKKKIFSLPRSHFISYVQPTLIVECANEHIQFVPIRNNDIDFLFQSKNPFFEQCQLHYLEIRAIYKIENILVLFRIIKQK
jgi:hypothetical protein